MIFGSRFGKDIICHIDFLRDAGIHSVHEYTYHSNKIYYHVKQPRHYELNFETSRRILCFKTLHDWPISFTSLSHSNSILLDIGMTHKLVCYQKLQFDRWKLRVIWLAKKTKDYKEIEILQYSMLVFILKYCIDTLF